MKHFLLLFGILALFFTSANAKSPEPIPDDFSDELVCNAFYQYTLGNCPNVSFFSGSTSNPGSIVAYNWDFGDGSFGSGANANHTYTANGTYIACLSILTSDSCTSTFCDSIVVACIAQPTCNAFYQYTLGNCPNVSFFSGSTSNPGSIVAYNWDFGDGSFGSGANTNHTYTTNGTYIACLSILTSDSCTSTYCDSIVVACIQQPTCQASFGFTTPQCPTVSFFGSSSTSSPGSIVNYFWDLGDGNTVSSPNSAYTHTYAANGTYIVCLSILTSDSCTSTFCDTVVINCIAQPTCNAFYQYTLGNCPNVSFFSGSTSNPGSIVAYNWDFGDGSFGSGANTNHTYTANGTYIACLSILTSDSCTSTYCDSIVVACIQQPTCQASFGFTTPQCPTVSFFGSSSTSSPGSIVNYFWDLGDGNTVSSPNSAYTHTYAANGTYIVCLSILTSDSCTSTFCDTVVINCIAQPTCNAFYQYTLGNCPNVSFFSGSTSNPGSIVAYNWDFGDGSFGSGANTNHTYTANGTYIACLSILTSDSCTSTYCDSIVVSCIQQPTCQASFGFTTPQCPTVSFFGSSSTSSPGSIVNYFWDLGDGNTVSSPNSAYTHTYAANGTYIVCLSILTSDSCTSTFCDTVVINCIQQPTCNAFYQYTLGNCPNVSFFSGSTSNPGSIVAYNWDFGDGSFGSGANTNHTYTANGTYIACLSILTSDSCTSTYCDSIVVSCIQQPTCNASFGFTTPQCPTVSFFGSSSTSSPGSIVNYFWDLGDGNTVSSPNSAYTHTYAANGTYIVCLSILTSDSCTSTFCDTVVINCIAQPTCNAFYQYTLGNCPNVSFFSGSTSNPGSIVAYNWDFGDGSFGSGANTNHTYTANGTYIACLSILTSDSCTSTYCDSIVVSCIQQPTCQASFGFTTPQCPTVSFFGSSSTSSPGSIVNYLWDLGDGNTVSSPNSAYTHTYAANGTYIVCLSILTSDSCMSTFCDTVVINCIQQPTCNAFYQYTLGNCPNVSFFSGSTSNPGSIVAYNWDFGDGSFGSGANTNHTYTANGTYIACLSILTTDSCTSTFCDTIAISCIQQVDCQAAFNWNQQNPPAVVFADQSTATPGTVTSWAWDFGDGATSGLQNPAHTYAASGTYVVCLTILTSDSCTSTACDTVSVSLVGLDPASDFAVSLYPNPVDQSVGLSYTLPTAQEVQVELYSMEGKELQGFELGWQNVGEHKLQINTAQLSDGMYFIRFRSAGKMLHRKFVVKH